MNILILEDHPGIRTALQMLLELEGFTVSSVDCGEDALELLAKKSFDTILLDLNTNGMSAYEFVQEMDRIVGAARPVLGVLSASSALDFESRRLNANFSMQKPFDNDDLIHRLKLIYTNKYLTASRTVSVSI